MYLINHDSAEAKGDKALECCIHQSLKHWVLCPLSKNRTISQDGSMMCISWWWRWHNIGL